MNDGTPEIDAESELARLLEFFHVCPVGLVAFADDGTVRLANPAAVNLLLPTAGRAALSNIVEGLSTAWPELATAVASSGGTGRVRDSHRLEFRHGGERTWLSLSLVRVEPDHHMLVVSNVTTEVAAEENVRDREFRLRTLFDSIDEGYCVAEIVVDDNGKAVDYRFIEVNPLFEEMTGLVDPVGCTALELVPDLEPHWIETYSRVALDKETLRFQQGSEAMGRWFDVFSMPVLPVGRFAIVFKDISERHQWEQSERRAHEQTEVLLRNARLLAAAITVEELAGAVIGSLSQGFGLDFSAINLVENGGQIRILPSAAIRDAVVAAGVSLESYLRGDVAANLPGPEAIRTNATVVCNTAAEIGERFPDVAAALQTHGAGSLLATPLRDATGEVLGSLVVVNPEEGRLDAEMLALLQGLAEQTGLALDRAQLFDRVVVAQRKEHDIAVSLQEALLPEKLVDHPQLEIAADYRAGSELLAVGGDWYDTFVWPNGLVGIVVGDVAGHDLSATASMGRLRAALAALAPLTDPNPTAVLAALEHCASGPGGTDFMTAACVVIDPATGEAKYATAGHPPPLVVSPGGSTRWLDAANSVPIGVRARHERAEARVALEPGSLVVLYTDGLVERPGEPITDGLSRLASAASELASTAVSLVPSRLIAELTRNGPGVDDVVTVASRWVPTREDAVPPR